MKSKPKLSYWWAILFGLLFPVVQIGIYYFRFGRLNPYSPLLDYIMFFLTGTVGGLIFIALLRRSGTKAAQWSVTLAFLLATPIATLGMLGGGLLGPVGVVLFPTLIWGIITTIGYLIGGLISRSRMKRSEG
jgi:hypothetical protein